MSQEKKHCRITGTDKLITVLNLGEQCLTSVYPLPEEKDPSTSPLDLVFADDPEGCYLVQLRHNADMGEMYGTTYGYHSSISPMMVRHLKEKFDELVAFAKPKPGEFVLDIGCNDGTFLNFYRSYSVKRFGVDPSSKKFRDMFDSDIEVAYDFFTADTVRAMSGNASYKIVSSIAMFYDIDQPLQFVQEVADLLQKDGIWLVEIAYLPLMMTNLAYDQVMHEHLTYLGLRQMDHLARKSGLKILDISTNHMNGGSINIIMGKEESPYPVNSRKIDVMMQAEAPLSTLAPFKRFANRVANHRDEVRHLLGLIKDSGKVVWGYGASTKGNVIMNYCGLGTSHLPAVCDKNPYKHGRVTPQTRIPIVSQEEMRNANPDYLFVNIWHLRREVLKDEKDYIMNGGQMIFSLPRPHLVNKDNYERYLNASFDDLAYPL